MDNCLADPTLLLTATQCGFALWRSDEVVGCCCWCWLCAWAWRSPLVAALYYMRRYLAAQVAVQNHRLAWWRTGSVRGDRRPLRVRRLIIYRGVAEAMAGDWGHAAPVGRFDLSRLPSWFAPKIEALRAEISRS